MLRDILSNAETLSLLYQQLAWSSSEGRVGTSLENVTLT